MAGATWTEERALLEVHIDGHPMSLGEFPYALNEVVIHKRDTASMVVVDVHRGDHFVNTYWADGLLVSTPTGSTAYSLSAGRSHCAPQRRRGHRDAGGAHNLNDRPLVVPLDQEITLMADGRDAQFFAQLGQPFIPP